jgi:hypothetical protein
MIINVSQETFGGTIRNGDMIAAANIVEHLRRIEHKPIRFYFEPGTISSAQHCQDFHSWMIAHTDYFSAFQGENKLSWQKVNLWDFRDICGDLVKIENAYVKEKKIVICPIFDAPYNLYRNWPTQLFLDLIKKYDNYDGEKVLVSDKQFNIPGWTDSSNLIESLKHIMTAEVYVGGDTGLSHFVGALDQGPEAIYYTSSRGLLHTTPFYWMTEKKGTMKTYWLDFEGTKWQ